MLIPQNNREDNLRLTRLRAPLLLLALFTAVPMFAAAIAADVTIPASGYLQLPNDLVYRTEVVITNHRDVRQYVAFSFINDGHDQVFRAFPLEPHETEFLSDGGFGSGGGQANRVGALRIRAVVGGTTAGEIDLTPDPNGRIEAHAFIVADRGRFASNGSSRQEVAGIASSDYHAEEAVFLGVRHSPNTGVHTNVGIVNMHPTQTETFFVEYQFHEPTAVVVPPLSVRQIRVPGGGNSGRYVRVYPEWALTDEAPARTTPWVAYASTVDTQTGDAFSGMRVPAGSRYDFPDEP